MWFVLTRLGSFAGLLALSGAALAQSVADNATVPEPGVLELLGIAAVVGWVASRNRRGKGK